MLRPPLFAPSLWLTLLLAGVLILLGATSALSDAAFQYDRARILDGQWWRLLTGQLVHFGLFHLGSNLMALVVIGWVLLRHLRAWQTALIWATSFASVGLGLLLGSPTLDYYAGLSGALHGMLVAGFMLTFSRMPVINTLGLLLVTVKLWREQAPHFDTAHAHLPVPVAVDAHLYGALAGLAAGAALWFIRRATRRSLRPRR